MWISWQRDQSVRIAVLITIDIALIQGLNLVTLLCSWKRHLTALNFTHIGIHIKHLDKQ